MVKSYQTLKYLLPSLLYKVVVVAAVVSSVVVGINVGRKAMTSASAIVGNVVDSRAVSGCGSRVVISGSSDRNAKNR